MYHPGSGTSEPSPSCFFFQAEDGIRDLIVTGVQTCALPIFSAKSVDFSCESPGIMANVLSGGTARSVGSLGPLDVGFGSAVGYGNPGPHRDSRCQIGRASCRERG